MDNTNIKEKLNIFKILLNGTHLIEASAGTGKTFTIVLLYLRLLLGIKKHKNTNKLSVKQILVVTFTNAAKEELYIRIKDGIHNLYLTCINKKNKNTSLNFFLKEIKDINEAISILKIASNDINNSSIYTIHGFCQHILKSHTFDLNYLFEEKIIENEDDLHLQAVQDFWRHCFYNLPENIINIIYKDYKNPEHLLKYIKPFLHIQSIINFPENISNNEELITRHHINIKKINIFKEIWLINYQQIIKEINILQINKKIYSNFNTTKWINHITIWAESETKDYTIPISLKYFAKKNIKQNTTNNICSNYIIFKETEKILKTNFSLKNIVIIYAIKKIKRFLLKEKKKKSFLGFNDLLNILFKRIKKEKYLRELIRKQYPAVFIDEFQDTDIQQYKIFNRLYKKNKKTVLFLIGDPKQAIYSFRGADIFSYLYVKSKIKKYYYLDTNWRSSINMCKSINMLFSQNENIFIFENIPYTPILPSCQNSKMNFIINKVPQIPIRFFFQKKQEVRIDDYQSWISKQCANEISFWLNCAKKGQAKIITKKNKKILTPNDIAILVRNKKEASLIQEELKKLNIISIYSSNKNSVFHTIDAQELLWLLKSILDPDNEKLLQQSFSTHILKKLLFLSKNQLSKEHSFFVIEKLYEYYRMWKEIDIYYMIKSMILEYQKYSNLTEINANYMKNLNFLHIAEILQEQFQYFEKKTSLIRWFQKKILEKTHISHNEYIRNFNESQSIKIITIHKSKGLEYPIVWIPFSIDFKQALLPIYHDKKNFKMFFNTKESNEYLKISDKERLAEDIRLLYVAITRSVLHCSIGIACLTKNRKENRNHSDIHKSSIGYLIQNGQSMNYENLYKKLKKISVNNLIEVKNNTDYCKMPIQKQTIYLVNKNMSFNANIKNTWNITSFTQLNKENKLFKEHKTLIQKKFLINKNKSKNKLLTIHSFPKGKNTGLMIHYILKHLHVFKNKNDDWVSEILEEYNLPVKWTQTLITWIKNIINIPITNKKIILSKIHEKLCIKELEFFLPIKNILYHKELNKIIQSVDPISVIAPKLFFNPVKGLLKGFIDLVFFWKEKYYILDYKSNWLGKNNDFYSDTHIKKEMIRKRYDLQYQIYTIVIHKYLQKKIKNYNYKKDFGGIMYFFLRASEIDKKNSGVFYTIPDFSLIEKIISLIS